MKIFTIVFLNMLFSVSVYSQIQDIYQFKVEDIYGKAYDFSTLKGKRIIIVNTASRCRFTPQYKDLQKLYEKYRDNDLVVICFPSNDFFNREPGTNSEIAEFCKRKFNITFPMMSKIHVKGDNQHPVYQFLTQKKMNGFSDSKVKWNFQKYLINKNGKIDKIIPPRKRLRTKEIIAWIEGKYKYKM